MKGPTYLTAADVARILGVTPGAVRLMYKRQALAVSAKTVGGIHLFLKEEVDRVAHLRQRPPVSFDLLEEAQGQDHARRAGGGR